jgi:hypothetical protein
MKKTILAFSLFSILVGLSVFTLPQKTEASTIIINRHSKHTTSMPYGYSGSYTGNAYNSGYSNYGYGSGYYNASDYTTYPTYTSSYPQNSNSGYGSNPYGNNYGNNGSYGSNSNIINNYTTNNYYYGYGYQTGYAYPASNVYAPTQYTSGSPSAAGYSNNGTTCYSSGYCY